MRAGPVRRITSREDLRSGGLVSEWPTNLNLPKWLAAFIQNWMKTQKEPGSGIVRICIAVLG
jgi:hypothetical protein